MLLFLTIVLAISFAGRLTKPIINLITASKNISGGKLDSKVPEIESDEEIKSLNQNFNNTITISTVFVIGTRNYQIVGTTHTQTTLRGGTCMRGVLMIRSGGVINGLKVYTTLH